MSTRQKSVVVLIILCCIFFSSAFAQNPVTVAEKSNYTNTSLHIDVMEFLFTVQQNFSNINIEYFGKTAEGRLLPLVILGNPVPGTPAEVLSSGRIPVFIQANIHAGEVEGKEAAQMLIRDIVSGPLKNLLDNQVILIAPIFNADGNDKVSKNNRRRQGGPSGGVGTRQNGQNLDLNRDFIKTESPEVRSLIKNILNYWDPYMVVDCHTTNGSYHEEPVTVAPPHSPNGDRRIIDYTYFNLIKYAQKKMKSEDNILMVEYGHPGPRGAKEPTGWYSFDPSPMYASNYFGLRNRLSVLDENYSYADFKTRVLGCYSLLKWLLTYTNDNSAEIAELIKKVDADAVQPGTDPTKKAVFALKSEISKYGDPITVHGYEMETYKDSNGRTRRRPTEKTKKSTYDYYGVFNVTESIPLPAGYIFPASLNEIAEKLILHGIKLEKLEKEASMEVEVFKVKNVKNAQRYYEGHLAAVIEGEYKMVTKKFPAGTYYVSMAQKLNRLAATLLEPQCPDGLAKWNYFDRYLRAQWSRSFRDYPVCRIIKDVPLAKSIVK